MAHRTLPAILLGLMIPAVIALTSLEASATDPAPSLMMPTGQHAVGMMLLDWIDSSRGEPGTDDPNDVRQIPVQIWYPTSDVDGDRAPYRPRVEAFREAWGEESIEFFQSVHTPWSADGPVSSVGPFPVLIFSHGWGARSSSHGTFLANIASHGYVVVGINHPFLGRVAFASGEVTEPDDSQFADQEHANRFYAEDVSFVLDQVFRLNEGIGSSSFRGTLDLERIAAAGHSSGFPCVSGAAVTDPRIRALISFDSGVPKVVRREGLDIPILLFRAETDSYTSLFFREEGTHDKGTIYDVDFFRVHRGDFYDVEIVGTTHNSIYDEYLFAESNEERKRSQNSHRQFAKYTVAFLGEALNGQVAPLLHAEGGPSADVVVRHIPAFETSPATNR